MMLKDSNPKYMNGAKKVPLASVPPITSAYLALGHHEGVVKYGAWNWRVAGASAHTYVSAAKRHLDLWFEGQDRDPITGVPHLANALASISILVDASHSGTLVDDRPIDSGYQQDIESIHKMVQHLNELFGDKSPKHHTRVVYENERIADAIKANSLTAFVQQPRTTKQLRTKVPANKAAARTSARGK